MGKADWQRRKAVQQLAAAWEPMAIQTFVETQRRYYAKADPAHFDWQTSAPFFADSEAALVRSVDAKAGERLLELGCGEGSNLFHLRGRKATCFGIDFSVAKAAFAHREIGIHAAAADATALPFANSSFDAVLIRDLLHHLPRPSLALAETRRVLRPGGRLTLIEPNAKSPLVLMQAAAIRAERGLFRSFAGRLRSLLEEQGFLIEHFETLQPFPIARVLLHPKMGLPGLGGYRAVIGGLSLFNRIAARLLPRPGWMYLIFRSRAPHS
jgi:SAM-dependent methyltransferase